MLCYSYAVNLATVALVSYLVTAKPHYRVSPPIPI